MYTLGNPSVYIILIYDTCVWHCGAGTTTPHACDTRELTEHSRVRVIIRVRVKVVSQACRIAVTAPPCHTHAAHVIYVKLTIKLGPARLCDEYTRVTAII